MAPRREGKTQTRTGMKPTEHRFTYQGQTITVALEIITPETAALYLATQVRNRKIRPRHVATLKRDITRGDWQLTAAAIVFDANGALIDGQHRLTAIRESGNNWVPLFVFRGFPPAAQDAMDIGAIRSVAEQLGMDGRLNANLLTSYCNAIARGICSYTSKLSLPQVRAMLDALPHVALATKADSPKLHFRSALYLGPIAYAVHIPGKAQKVGLFFDAFTKGIGITGESSPAWRAREYARGRQVTMGSSVVKDVTGYMADCLQAWIEGETMPSAKPTGTGLSWLRTRTASHYAAVRQILGFQS